MLIYILNGTHNIKMIILNISCGRNILDFVLRFKKKLSNTIVGFHIDQ